MPDGEGVPHAVRVVQVVNAHSDPLLAGAARAGELNKREDGTALAEPFVYHDPSLPLFVLVLPRALAHRELELRAELLLGLSHAQGTNSEPLPAYVRRAEVALGPSGLAQLVQSLGEAETRAEALAQREERLRVRAEEVTRREDELRDRIEELVRGQEQLVAERANHEKSLATSAVIAAVREQPAPFETDAIEQTMVRPPAAEFVSDELDQEDDLEAEAIEPGPESDGTAESVEPLEEPEGTRAEEGDGVLSVDPLEPAEGARSSGVPAAGPAPRDARESYVAVVDNEPRFWAPTTPEAAARVVHEGAVPTLQVDPDGAAPLALLSALYDGSEVLARCVLDATRPDDREVIEALGRDFRVRLELVSAEGRSLGTTAVAAPCEDNARRIAGLLAERVARVEREGWDAGARTAARSVLAREGIDAEQGRSLLALAGEEAPLGTVEQVKKALERYEEVLPPERLERFLLSQGVAATQLETVGRRLVLTAMRVGVVLSDAMTVYALAHGVAPDGKALATRALTAFARSCAQPLEALGHDRRSAYAAWLELLRWARAQGVEEHEAARSGAAKLYDPDDAELAPPPDPRAAPTDEQLDSASEETLLEWALNPRAQEPLVQFVLRRDPEKHQPLLGRLLRMLKATRAAELTAQLLPQGDALGDLWVELLGSSRPHVSVLGAAAASEVRLRRALNPLMHRALLPEQPAALLYGWAAGSFGVAAVRALQSGRADELEAETASWILAHAIRCGAGRDVEKVRAQGQGTLVDAAMRATGRVDEARQFDLDLRNGRGVTPGTALVFEVLRRLSGAAGAE